MRESERACNRERGGNRNNSIVKWCNIGGIHGDYNKEDEEES